MSLTPGSCATATTLSARSTGASASAREAGPHDGMLRRRQGEDALYGLMVGAVGPGAVVGALALPALERRFGAERLVQGGSALTALVLARLALLPVQAVAVAGR